MKIIHYRNSPVFRPAGSFNSVRAEMDRLFDAAFPALSSLQREGFLREGVNEFPVDLYRDKNSFVVRAELPGFRKEDLSVEVEAGVLTVTGHQKTESPAPADGQKDQPANGASPERRVSRSISLPEQAAAENIQAQYENGVLTVTIPQREEAKPRQIKVDVK